MFDFLADPVVLWSIIAVLYLLGGLITMTLANEVAPIITAWADFLLWPLLALLGCVTASVYLISRLFRRH